MDRRGMQGTVVLVPGSLSAAPWQNLTIACWCMCFSGNSLKALVAKDKTRSAQFSRSYLKTLKRPLTKCGGISITIRLFMDALLGQRSPYFPEKILVSPLSLIPFPFS
jgi:hypothetical protein